MRHQNKKAALLALILCPFLAAGVAFAQTEMTAPEEPIVESAEPVLPGSEPEEAVEDDASALPPGPPGVAGLSFDNSGAELGLEKSPEEVQENTRKQAFDAALQGLLPLRPEEIRQLLEHFDRTQESVELPVYPAPKPEVTVQNISLDPGTLPLVVKVAYGYVTTLSFLDATGEPWPIQHITWAGNFDVVQIEAEDDKFSHFIRITPQSEFAFGNLSVQMLTLQTPVIMSLETSRDIVHYRFDAIIPENGPFAKASIIDNGGGAGITTAAGDVDMSNVLEGVAPSSAVKLKVTGVDGRTTAYRFNGLTYLRTPLALLSPAWISSAASADGMRVYALNQAPVVLLSEKGKMVRAHLSDREDILE